MIIYKDILQGSEEWLKLRWWVITWTKLKWVLAWPQAQLTQVYELIAEEFAELEPTFTSPAMQRWNDLEPIARAKYEEITKQKVEEVWFIKSEVYQDDFGSWLWLSPDWIIYKDDKIIKAIEIKCPWAKNHCKYIIEKQTPKEYLEQILNYFLVIDDLQELDFITYNPDFYIKDLQLVIITITRKDLEKDLEKAKDKILKFRELWVENIRKLNS